MKEENVLLLSMSTLPYNRQMHHYQIKDGGRTYDFNGIVQLEAGTKFVLSKLAGENKKVDRIIIMASAETRDQREKQYDNATAIEFYKDRIRDYIMGNENHKLGLENKIEETRFEKPEYYPDIDALFHVIEIDEGTNQYRISFWRTVKEIKGNSPDRHINLYMDMQGGDRNAITQMNAIVELLRNQNVTIRGRYATKFHPGNMVQRVAEVSESYRTYELMAAMQVFKNYGWGKELVQYFGNQESKRDKKLVEAIQTASDAIRLSNVGSFDQAVNNIQKLTEEFENSDRTEGEKTQLDIVFEDIKEDYRPLLIDSRYKYIEQIRWCLRKGFLQQALTILEAKMPYEYVNNGLLYYCDQKDNVEKLIRSFEEIYRTVYQKSDNSYKMKDLNYYFIKYYKYDEKMSNIQMKYACQDMKDRIDKNLQRYYALCKKRNKANHAASSMSRNPNGFFCYMQRKYPQDQTWSEGSERSLKNLEKEVADFLNEFEKLADEVRTRNPDLKVIDLS